MPSENLASFKVYSSGDAQGQDDRKLELGIRRYQELKAARKKGRVTLYTDGSGRTSEYEIVEKE